MEETYIVEKTFGNGSKLVHLESFRNIMNDLGQGTPEKRYFKLPALETLEEVSILVLVRNIHETSEVPKP